MCREMNEGTHRIRRALSICGVWISPPKHPMSLKPRSSARTMRKLGRFFSAMFAREDIENVENAVDWNLVRAMSRRILTADSAAMR